MPTSSRNRRRRGLTAAIGASALIAALHVLPADASADEPAGGGSPGRPPAGDRGSRPFAIPAQPLGDALRRFTELTGIAVHLGPHALGGVRSSAVAATLTPAEALRALLRRTGYDARFLAPASAVLVARAGGAGTAGGDPELATIGGTRAQSQGYRSDSSRLGKLPQPLGRTPQTVDVVTRELMDDQGVTSLKDALRNVSGISLAAGEGGSQGDSLTIRGFQGRNDIYLDGMRDFGNYYRDTFDLEEVEVAKGSSSTLFGRGSTGGVVDQTSKTPALRPFATLQLGLGTANSERVAYDVDRALGATTAFRLNVLDDHANTAGRDLAETKRFGFAPSFATGLGTATRFTASYFHQSDRDMPDYGLPLLRGQPAPVDRANFYGFAVGDHFNADVDVATLRLDHDLAPNVGLREQVRVAQYARDVSASDGVFATQPAISVPLDTLVVNRAQHARFGTETFVESQTDYTVRGGRHTLVAGMELGRETSDEHTPAHTGLPTTSLLDPDPSQQYAYATVTPRGAFTAAHTLAFYALDDWKLGARLTLGAGVRWDRFDAVTHDTVAAAAPAVAQDVTKLTGRGSLCYAFSRAGNVYVAWGTSFDPSAEALALSTTAVPIAPEENENVELGSKWSFADNRLSVSGAVFRETKKNARTPSDAAATSLIAVGKELSTGFELEVAGRPARGWDLRANYTRLNTAILASDNPLEIGHPISNAPEHTFAFWGARTFPSRLQIGAGANYVSERFQSDVINAFGYLPSVPQYWRLDAMAKYPLSKTVGLQLNVYNLADRYYFELIHPDHVVPGAGRSATLSATMKL